MKRLITGILLGLLLFSIGVPGIVYADPGDGEDGLDVDIVVVGNDVDVDVDIYGDSPNVTINGDGLATVADVNNAGPRGGRGDLITWLAARRADKWVREIGQFLPAATAILILESGRHDDQLIFLTDQLIVLDGQLVVLANQLGEHETSINGNSDNITSLWGVVETLDFRATGTEEQVEALLQWQLDMEKKWLISTIIFGAVGSLLVIMFIVVSVNKR